MTDGWLLHYEGFEPSEEGLREALCTLGNGCFATRGAVPEMDADAVHYPGTYAAGLYNRLRTDIAGHSIECEDLVNLPNWLCLAFCTEDAEWFNPLADGVLNYSQTLDLRRGLLRRNIRYRDRNDRVTRVEFCRFVHMAKRHIAATELRITAENWSGRMTVRSALDGRVRNAGVARYQEFGGTHRKPLETGNVGDDIIYLLVETAQSSIRIAEAARTRVTHDSRDLNLTRETSGEQDTIAQTLSFAIEQAHPVHIEKIVSLYTSRDPAIPEPALAAKTACERAGSFSELQNGHERAWHHYWQRCDIEIEPAEVQRNLRLNIFHVLQSVSQNTIDLDVGVPARGLHGEAYRGHVFWDELFVLPFFTLHMPDVTRSLLMYRYRRLNEARWSAQQAGFRGAMFPWQSGSDGREESQRTHLNPRSGHWQPDNSWLQRHVGSAIAYNVWHYVQVTGDMDFLSYYGAELILEIARFWVSAATYNPSQERYEIHNVMGPDEYHDAYPGAEEPGLKNNAYTNLMAAWVLSRALDVLDVLDEARRQSLCERLSLTPDEIAQFEDVSRRMRLVIDEDGIISQFEGYEALEEFDWAGYRARYGDISRLDRILEAEGDTPNRYKLSKQADVLMLFYLFSSEELGALFERLGYAFAYETIPDNVDYYLQRTAHGSTLSRVVHSWVLARRDRTQSWRLLTEALESDLADSQRGTTPEGIHLGAMAGTIDLIQRCYSGLEIRGGVLWFNPCLPETLKAIRQRIRYRGHSIDMEITQNTLRLNALKGWAPPVRIGVGSDLRNLASGGVLEFSI